MIQENKKERKIEKSKTEKEKDLRSQYHHCELDKNTHKNRNSTKWVPRHNEEKITYEKY